MHINALLREWGPLLWSQQEPLTSGFTWIYTNWCGSTWTFIITLGSTHQVVPKTRLTMCASECYKKDDPIKTADSRIELYRYVTRGSKLIGIAL